MCIKRKKSRHIGISSIWGPGFNSYMARNNNMLRYPRKNWIDGLDMKAKYTDPMSAFWDFWD